MKFEINTENYTDRITLSRAAELSGYHQDYLGQLCRTGKLEAVKIGRNWFTSSYALKEISSGDTMTSATEQIDAGQQVYTPPQPVITENVTIQAVEGLPIAIRPVRTQTIRNTNSVQGILTSMRIESLQKEVQDLRKLLFKLMDEVKTHTNILQTQNMMHRVQDALKHTYVSNFDFNPVDHAKQTSFIPEQLFEGSNNATEGINKLQSRPRYFMLEWLAASVVIVTISFLSVGVVTSSFFGEEPPVTALYYRADSSLVSEPAVAGVVVEPLEILPTDNTGGLDANMIR